MKNKMEVLVACEESQVVTKAFRAKGHDAFSCDLIACSGDKPEWHLKGNVLMHLDYGWDMVIAHPPCTFLSNSGVRWLYNSDGSDNMNRWVDMYKAAYFFNQFRSRSRQFKLCIENPIPHKYARYEITKYTQIIQPWQFGHPEQKATCLWLYGLPKLKPTNIVEGREQRIWKMAPGPERAKERSKTYLGIAKAMADQWG